MPGGRKLSATDIAELRIAFKEQDCDHTGEISQDELRELLRVHYGLDKEDVGEIEDMLPQRFSEIDDDEIVFEEWLQYQSADLTLRFDVQFVRYMRQKAEDYLGLQVYLPFLGLFIFFLLSEKGLGSSYWATYTVNDLVMGNEFELTDELRFVKLFADIATEEEFWQWVEGPLLGGFWGEEDSDTATGLAQYGNMPIGAMKLRQVRVAPEACDTTREGILKAAPVDLSARIGAGAPWGTFVSGAERLTHFPRECYPPYALGTLDTEGYIVQEHNASTDPYSGSVATMRLNATWAGDCPPWGEECDQREWQRIHARVRNFTLKHEWDLAGEAFVWRDCSGTTSSRLVLNGSLPLFFYGKVGTYTCDGYALIIPFSWPKSKFTEAVGLLKDGITVGNWTDLATNTFATERKLKWVDSQTRALSVEMFTFNQNLEVFSRLQYVTEVTAGGAWVPVYQSINFKLFSFSANSFGYNFFMFVFFAYVLFYVASWTHELWSRATQRMVDKREEGCASRVAALAWVFTRSFWMVVDFINYLLFLVVWSLRFVWMGYGITKTSVLITDWYPDEYETMAQSSFVLMMLDSINGLLCIFKVFYFLQLNPQFNVLTKTIAEASGELVGLLLIFVAMFLGFCLMGYVVYGHVLEEFRDMATVVGSLLRWLVGDFDYVELREARRLFTPIFFTLFQLLMFFLLLNMVIAVLSDAFASVSNNKWQNTRLLDKLIEESSAEWIKPVRGETTNFITHMAIVREVIYWSRRIVLFFQGLLPPPNRLESGMTEASWYKHILREKHNNLCRNPRMFWRNKEEQIVKRKRCMTFDDKLNLNPLSLIEYLTEGDQTEEAEEAFGGFGEDWEKLYDALIERPADKMELNTRDVLLELLERHHYWSREMSEVAEFMSHIEYCVQAREKQEQIDNMMQREQEMAYGEEEEKSESSGDGPDESSEEEEAEEKERLIVREATERIAEAKRAVHNLEKNARSIALTSNREEMHNTIQQAISKALQGRTQRQQVVDRYESGAQIRGLRVHTNEDGRLVGLKAARFGRYIKPEFYLHLVKGFREDQYVLVRDREWVESGENKKWARARVRKIVKYFDVTEEGTVVNGVLGTKPFQCVTEAKSGQEVDLASLGRCVGATFDGPRVVKFERDKAMYQSGILAADRPSGLPPVPATEGEHCPVAESTVVMLTHVQRRPVWVEGRFSEAAVRDALAAPAAELKLHFTVIEPQGGAGVYLSVCTSTDPQGDDPDESAWLRFEHIRREPTDDEEELGELNIWEPDELTPETWTDKLRAKQKLDTLKAVQWFRDDQMDQYWRRHTTDYHDKWDNGWYFPDTTKTNLFRIDKDGIPKHPNLYGVPVPVVLEPPRDDLEPKEDGYSVREQEGDPGPEDPLVRVHITESIFVPVVPSADVELALHHAAVHGVIGAKSRPFEVSEDAMLQSLIEKQSEQRKQQAAARGQADPDGDGEGNVPWEYFDWADEEERHTAQTRGAGGDESHTCFAQLEVLYEPTAPFRDHLVDQMRDIIRKRLPNLLRQELSTAHLMALLKRKVEAERKPGAASPKASPKHARQ
eukprot:TRINITY_DN60316_c0_g1_i1.p1 TRINITY_DN60316_c0_g1~~TRINITY_DN60316_c0_g1_i1.p1  ORF type:complete len:1559 (+),score=632.37 TRINITY_DN60316_c0_g1_i1:128-4804(+)